MAAPSRTFCIRRWERSAVFVLLAWITSNGWAGPTALANTPPEPPRLAAASSLGLALEPWAAERGAQLHLAATGVLVGQLIAGAPADAVVLADRAWLAPLVQAGWCLSLIHISEPTRRTPISYAVFCLKKKKR